MSNEQQRQGRALGVRLSAMRGKVTQADLAERARMPLDTLRKIELGKVAGPSFFTIGQIVDAAGGRLDALWADMRHDAVARGAAAREGDEA